MKLHVVSDLHLSVAGFDLPETAADVIVLAGDIARPPEACAWAKRLGKPVIYVAGNHEFYGGSIDGTIAALRAATRRMASTRTPPSTRGCLWRSSDPGHSAPAAIAGVACRSRTFRPYTVVKLANT